LKFVFWWCGNGFFCLQKNRKNPGWATCQVISKEVCKDMDYMFTKFNRGFCLNEYGLNEEVSDRKHFSESGLV